MEINKGIFSEHDICIECEGIFFNDEDVYEINEEIAYCEICYYEYIKLGVMSIVN